MTDEKTIALRFRQMKSCAKRHGKEVPSTERLQAMADAIIENGMKCPVCDRKMNWRMCHGSATVVTLQHDRDGTMRLMCKGCNSKHAQHPGDTFYSVPKGSKRCPKCETVKPREEFYFQKTRNHHASKCKSCERATSLAWHKANPERSRAYRVEFIRKNRAALSEYERLRRRRKKNEVS